MQVHFQPQEAAAFRVAAACSLDNGELLTVKVSGGKLPFTTRLGAAKIKVAGTEQRFWANCNVTLQCHIGCFVTRSPCFAHTVRCPQVNGMAKFPFLSLESDCVDLGDVVIGQTAEACVRFGNHSPVPAHFFLAAGPGSHDGTIAVQPSRSAWH